MPDMQGSGRRHHAADRADALAVMSGHTPLEGLAALVRSNHKICGFIHVDDKGPEGRSII